MDKSPLVSIGMPVYNCLATLPLALASLLAQTYQNWELLLIDDGSSDRTLQVAQSFADSRIRIVSDGTNKGLAARLNQAISMSRGEYFARMDGDDIAYPRRLGCQVAYLVEHPDVDLVGTWVMVFGQHGTAIGKRTPPEDHFAISARPAAGFPIAHPTYMGMLQWFQRYHYDEHIRSEDQDLLLRSYRSSTFANLPEILLGYREERIDLRKLLVYRYHLLHSMLREFGRQGRLGLMTKALIGQTLKSIADVVAVSTGLNYRLLRHRARPCTQAEEQEWMQIWQTINQRATQGR